MNKKSVYLLTILFLLLGAISANAGTSLNLGYSPFTGCATGIGIEYGTKITFLGGIAYGQGADKDKLGYGVGIKAYGGDQEGYFIGFSYGTVSSDNVITGDVGADVEMFKGVTTLIGYRYNFGRSGFGLDLGGGYTWVTDKHLGGDVDKQFYNFALTADYKF